MAKELRALVIGCGAIGAGYDLDTQDVTTHAKAYAMRPGVALTLTDLDPGRAAMVAARYGASVLENPDNDQALNDFDIISLCTATAQHAAYLNRLLALPSKPFILCEKPVVDSLEAVAALEQIPEAGQRVLVNYIRRFQPGYHLLKQRLQEVLNQSGAWVRHLEVRYQRGLLNNGGHAIDLLVYLLGLRPELHKLQWLRYSFDAFPDDPTASLQGFLDEVPLTMIGFEQAEFPIFEIDIHLTSSRFRLFHSGDTIQYIEIPPEGGNKRLQEREAWRQEGVLKDYMVPVLDAALACRSGIKPTNFMAALAVNRTILTAISQINQGNGYTGN